MKTLIITLLVCFIAFGASAQIVTKSVTSSKTAAVNLNFSTDRANKPFGLQIVCDSANMHANDTIVTSYSVSNDNVNFKSFTAIGASTTLKKTVPSCVVDTILVYKYLRVTLTPSSNDSTFTIYGYLFK